MTTRYPAVFVPLRAPMIIGTATASPSEPPSDALEIITSPATNVITIDGPAASGKDSTAQEVAKRLGFSSADSGAYYRFVALRCQDMWVKENDLAMIRSIAANSKLHFKDGRIYNANTGEDVTDQLKEDSVAQAASKFGTIPTFRNAVSRLQLLHAGLEGLVTTGRDQWRLFPEASLHVYMQARPEVRAARRVTELRRLGKAADLTVLASSIAARDYQDQNRKVAPLIPGPGSLIVDTSDITINDAVDQILKAYSNAVSTEA